MQKLILHDDKERTYRIENKITIFIALKLDQVIMKTPIMSSVCIINKMCRKLFNYSLNDSFLIQIQIKLELYHRKRKIIFSCQVFFPRIYHGYFQETSVNKLRVVVSFPIRYIYVLDFSHTNTNVWHC